MRVTFFFLIGFFCLFYFNVHGRIETAFVDQDEKWQQEFRLDREPSAYSNNWKLHRWSGPVSLIAKGWLRLASFSQVHGESAGVIWKYENHETQPKVWDGSKPSTVEFRAEISTRSGVEYGATFTVADDKKYYPFLLPAAQMTTYRIELDKGVAKLYRTWDGVVLQESVGVPFGPDIESRNYVYFGDSGIGVDGTSTWEFVRWTNSGIIPRAGQAKRKAFGFERPLDFSLFPDDARQWNQYEKSIWITDLSTVHPSSYTTHGQREKGKWKVLPFKTDGMRGNMLSVYQRTNAQPIKLSLKGAKGKHAIYIGLSTAPAFHNSERSGIRVKLSKELDFRNLFNDMDWLDHKRDVIQEVFYTVADIQSNEVLEIAQIPNLPAAVAYIRLVPVQQQEYVDYNRDRDNPLYKRNIATIDGHGMLLYNRASTASDIRGHFRMFENSDYGKWWFQVLGADLVNYPSKVGTMAGAGNVDFPRWYDEEFVASLKSLVDNEVNTLTVARQMAREMKKEFHVMIRPQGWAAAIPFEETFNSQFYLNNSQWRCVDEYGVPTMYMSYAVPEVRKQILDVIKEAVEMSDPDGVGLLFNRGMPLMLWEKPFADAFKNKFKVDLKDVPFDDDKIAALRAEIMTGFLRDLNEMLNNLVAPKGSKRYKVSMAVLDQRQNQKHGIAVEQWIREGLVDEVTVPPNDVKRYSELQNAHQVGVYPLILTWDGYSRPGDFAKRMISFYDDNVDGITVWDADVEFYKKPAEPHLNHVLRYIGHKELMMYWNENTMPRPNTFRVIQMGDNAYSGWLSNSGF